eukprot:7286389-Heterocapsa_arctica.AAC.1
MRRCFLRADATISPTSSKSAISLTKLDIFCSFTWMWALELAHSVVTSMSRSGVKLRNATWRSMLFMSPMAEAVAKAVSQMACDSLLHRT